MDGVGQRHIKLHDYANCCHSPIADQNQKKPVSRGKTEEMHAVDGTTSRRPLFESRMSRGLSNGNACIVSPYLCQTFTYCYTLSILAPEDIVLGPPKIAFASSARNTNKALDPSIRTKASQNDDDVAKDNHQNYKEKYDKEGRRYGREEPSKDSKQGSTQNRRSLRDDSEPWSTARQHKTNGNDAFERPSRRNGEREQERDKDSSREPRVQRGFENHRRDTDREGSDENSMRRTEGGRNRFEAPWSRDDERQEGKAAENPRTMGTARDWREKEKLGMGGTERDWNRSTKQERDPEWMDEPEPEEKKQSHTQADFERWKERMRASNGTTQDSSVEQQPAREHSVSALANNAVESKVETPLVMDPNFDGFFGLWNEPKDKCVSNGTQVQPANHMNKVNTPKPSKFTGFFNPKPAPAEADPEPPVPKLLPLEPAKDSSNEDKEGFQRILQLLDRQQSSAARISTPPRDQLLRNLPASPPMQSPQSRNSAGGLESLLASQANRDALPQNRDSEFLLKLMQQTQQPRRDTSQANFSDQRQAGPTGSNVLPFSNLLISPRDLLRQTPASPNLPPGLYNEPARDDIQRRDKLNPNSDRNGPPLGFYEPPNPNHTQRHPSVGHAQQPQLPAGLQRPPGLDQLPSSYPQFLIPRQNNIPPPPGFQAPLRNPNAFPPGLMANMPNPNERGSQYGMRPAVNGPLGMPPPGFMNMNVPPPGLPPLQFNQEGRMSPPRMFPGSGAQRPHMDGFADTGSFQLPPGGYRRQD